MGLQTATKFGWGAVLNLQEKTGLVIKMEKLKKTVWKNTIGSSNGGKVDECWVRANVLLYL